MTLLRPDGDTMSKTLLLMLLVLLLSLLGMGTFIGCGQQPSSVETPTPTPSPTPSPTAPTQLTMLSITEGHVFVMKSGTDSWLEAQVGTTLEPGDTIKAGDDSRAVITFFEGSTIELEAGTEINVVTLDIAADTGSTAIRLKQEIGKTVSRVEKLADASSVYEVEAPAAIAAVRGSIMLVYVDPEGGTTIGCEAGNVTGTAQGITVPIPVGMQRFAKPGQLLSDPVPIPSPPPVYSSGGGSHGGGGGGGSHGGGGGGGIPHITAIAITKTANCTTAHEGDKIAFTYKVTNAGNTPLSHVSVVDDKVSVVTYQSGDSDHDGKLDTKETWIFTSTYTVGTDDSSPLVNTAIASGTDALGKKTSAQASASVTILIPNIAITKTANCNAAHAGDLIAYTYNVTNPGDTSLYNVTVEDDKAGNAAYQNGDTNKDSKLDIGETWMFNATYTVTSNDTSPLVNIATASAIDASGSTVSANATATVTITIIESDIAITKTANCTSAHEGDHIAYTYNVTNPGDTPLYNVTVSDDKAGNATYQNGDTNGDSKLDVGETWMFNATYTVTSNDTSPLVNIAAASGTDALGRTVTDQASASVTILIGDIIIELTWDTDGTDFDAHFIRPGGVMWGVPDDCHWMNPNPDWGLPGVTEDNPSLNADDVDGYGAEYITLEQPYETGTYQFKVHYWNDFGHGQSTATVRIWINGIQSFEASKTMSEGDVWACTSIEWL